jgi:hypothetical protein
MTHKPTLPDAATPPWPATPPPHDQTAAADKPVAQEEVEAGRMSAADKRLVAGVASIAVGSAAIAAALLFAGRLNRPKSASTPVRPVVHEDAPDDVAPASSGKADGAKYIDIA